MTTENSKGNYEERIGLLKEMLTITEDMVSIINKEDCDAEDIVTALETRQACIDKLAELDNEVPFEAEGAYTGEELQNMNMTVRLILTLSNELETLLERSRNRLREELKRNNKQQKFAIYQNPNKIPEDGSSGKHFSYKK
ncbi:MAG: hypothetical protein K6F52_02860 [Clostridia bacterium]|nr:hypothetical protein [Clostridia bacterium]